MITFCCAAIASSASVTSVLTLHLVLAQPLAASRSRCCRPCSGVSGFGGGGCGGGATLGYGGTGHGGLGFGGAALSALFIGGNGCDGGGRLSSFCPPRRSRLSGSIPSSIASTKSGLWMGILAAAYAWHMLTAFLSSAAGITGDAVAPRIFVSLPLSRIVAFAAQGSGGGVSVVCLWSCADAVCGRVACCCNDVDGGGGGGGGAAVAAVTSVVDVDIA